MNYINLKGRGLLIAERHGYSCLIYYKILDGLNLLDYSVV